MYISFPSCPIPFISLYMGGFPRGIACKEGKAITKLLVHIIYMRTHPQWVQIGPISCPQCMHGFLNIYL